MAANGDGRPHEDDTGKITLQLHRELASAGSAGDDLIERLAAKLAEKSNGGNGGGKKFLGNTAGDWAKFLIAFMVSACLALGTWYLSVRDGLDDRPVQEEVDAAIQTQLKMHESRGEHPELQKRLERVEQKTEAIRDSQIRQEGTDARQTELLNDIKRELRRPR